MLVAVLAPALVGCQAPRNQIRLSALSSLSQVGAYPEAIEFEHGTFASRRERGAALLTADHAGMLFYYKGPRNRFELVLRKDGQSVWYARIGQRPMMLAAGRRIPKPAGVEVLREDGDTLEVAVDVALALQESKGYGSAFEHYPRHLRIEGTFTLARYKPEPPGPSLETSRNRLLLIMPPDVRSERDAPAASAPKPTTD